MGLIVIIGNRKVEITFSHINGKFNKNTKVFEPSFKKCTMAKIHITDLKTREEKHISALSKVNPLDNMDYSVGRMISFRRVMKRSVMNNEFTKEERKKIYTAFFRMSPKTKYIADTLEEVEVTIDRSPRAKLAVV